MAYAEALHLDPGRADALALLGGALLRLDRPADAVAALERAVALEASNVVAWLNLGRARTATGRLTDAAAAFATAVDLRPTLHEAALGQARALLAAGDVGGGWTAAERARAALEGEPPHPLLADAYAVCAAALRASGRTGEAVSRAERALRLRPRDPRLLAELGLALAADGQEEAGWDALNRAGAGPAEVPGLGAQRAAVARSAGLARLGRGDRESVAWLRRALASDPGDRAARTGLADALLVHPEEMIREDLCTLLSIDGIDHQRLFRGAERLLPPDRWPPGDVPPEGVLLLLRVIAASPTWIAALRERRRLWLRAALDSRPLPLDTVVAAAIQAWNTEHADVEAEDLALADALVALPDAPERLAAFALVKPLSAWPRTPASAPARLRELTLELPTRERALAAELPALPGASDETSEKVRSQYEENPYPRLVGVHLRLPVSLAAYVRGVAPNAPAPPETAHPRVLIAGGGTGQHPVGVASALAGAEVVVVDLSRASLGRAARLARASGVENIRFIQGDLLTLAPDDGLGSFDFVDCVGVLHHLADPERGGRALVSKLAPGGLLRLGLYSERGRADVVAARALVEERGWLPTPEGLRAARGAILALPTDHSAARLAASVDLYSQSGLRDLVFHACEHRYHPTEVARLVASIGLEVVALQHARPEPSALYRSRWPEDTEQIDLTRWDALESEHPHIFAGMIHVWCRRSPLLTPA